MEDEKNESDWADKTRSAESGQHGGQEATEENGNERNSFF